METEEVEQHPDEYPVLAADYVHWVMIQTLKRQNCTYAALHFNKGSQPGIYAGGGYVVGVPGRTLWHHSALLKLLKKHKKAENRKISLVLSPSAMIFRIEYSDLPTLKIIIRGKTGIVYEGNRRIGYTSNRRVTSLD